MQINVRNVNFAFSEIFWKLHSHDISLTETRNGPALVIPEPVTTIYQKPTERVLFNPKRDANPIFHLMESIWMLAGRNDVAFVSQFNKNMVNFSDDGEVFNAAYGHRWRRHFGFDQLEAVIKMLTHDPESRQAIVQMWDAADLMKNTKDKCCNMQVIFDLRDGSLNMTVLNRSNDIWWGAYGANAVHFSMLQEFIASALKRPVGVYRQVSHNLHLYTKLYDASEFINIPPSEYDGGQYADTPQNDNPQFVTPRPIMDNAEWRRFLWDCDTFCEDPFNSLRVYNHSFFKSVAVPVAMVAYTRKRKLGDGYFWADQIEAEDWRLAVESWISRREAAKDKITA
jgi:hypothetical protein